MSRWLAGEFVPKVAQAVAVAGGLGLSVGWLVAGQGPKWAAHLEANPDLVAYRATVLREAADALDRMAAGDMASRVAAVEDAAAKATKASPRKRRVAGDRKQSEE